MRLSLLDIVALVVLSASARAQTTPDEYALRKGWGHTTWEQAARVAEDAGVGRLVLFHHDPSHDDDALARICEQARAHFPHTDMAAEGLEIRI